MDDDKASQQGILVFCIVIVCILGIGGLIFMFSQAKTEFQSQSQISFSPTPSPTGVAVIDADTIVWKLYQSDQYGFSMQVPTDWNSEDYAGFYNNKSTLIAFGPGELPCATCSYLHEGYFSVRIFTQQQEPALYTAYQQNLQKAKDSRDYQRVKIDEKEGLMYANTVVIPTKKWIYEFSYDENDGNSLLAGSKIMQRVVSSFKSTELFSN